MVIVMVIFEMKKIFLKPINKIAFIILVATLCVVSYLAIDYVSYVDENGERITGFYSVLIHVCISKDTFESISGNNTIYFVIYSIIFKWVICSVRCAWNFTRPIAANSYGNKNL